MKVAIVFLVIVLVGVGLVMFDSWLVSEQPTHIVQASPAAKSK
jgi:hypothetical protein